MSRKHCGKRRNCLLRAVSPFATVFLKAVVLMRQNEYLWSKGLTSLQVFLFWKTQAAYSDQSDLDLKVIEWSFTSSGANTS